MNLPKSKVVQVGNVTNVASMASIQGCKISHLPIEYLDLCLGAPFKSKSIWNDVKEKMEQKLAGG